MTAINEPYDKNALLPAFEDPLSMALRKTMVVDTLETMQAILKNDTVPTRFNKQLGQTLDSLKAAGVIGVSQEGSTYYHIAGLGSIRSIRDIDVVFSYGPDRDLSHGNIASENFFRLVAEIQGFEEKRTDLTKLAGVEWQGPVELQGYEQYFYYKTFDKEEIKSFLEKREHYGLNQKDIDIMRDAIADNGFSKIKIELEIENKTKDPTPLLPPKNLEGKDVDTSKETEQQGLLLVDQNQLMALKIFALLNEDRRESKQANDLLDIITMASLLPTKDRKVDPSLLFRKVFVGLIPTQAHINTITDLRLDIIDPNKENNVKRIASGLKTLDKRNIVDVGAYASALLTQGAPEESLKKILTPENLERKNLDDNSLEELARLLLKYTWDYVDRSLNISEISKFGDSSANDILTHDERRYLVQANHGCRRFCDTINLLKDGKTEQPVSFGNIVLSPPKDECPIRPVDIKPMLQGLPSALKTTLSENLAAVINFSSPQRIKGKFG